MSPTVYRSVLTWAALCAAAGLLAVSIRAADDPRAKAPDKNSAAKPTSDGTAKDTADATSAEKAKRTLAETALEQPVTLDFKATPLKEAVAAIGKMAGTNLLLDAKGLSEAAVPQETPVTFSCDRLPLCTALHHMLHPLDLGFIIVADNVVLVTTESRERETIYQRVYDVRDLLAPATAGVATARAPYGQLIDVITGTVAPTTWSENGGSGSISPLDGRLVVVQTEECHQQLEDLLAELRTALKDPEKYRPSTFQHEGMSEKIYKALDARTDFDLEKTTLKDFGKFLRKLNVPVEFDDKALSEAGVDEKATVTLHAKNIRVADGLRLVLEPLDATYLSDHDVVLITSDAKCKEKVVTVIYPVGDLISPPANSFDDVDAKYADLIEAITNCVAPFTWSAAGGSGDVHALPALRVLIISQTQQIHQQCGQLLTDLRSAPHGDKRPAMPLGDLVVRKYEIAAKPESLDQCIQAVRTSVAPASWGAEGVYIVKIDNSLLVRQTRGVQALVTTFLADTKLLPPKPAQSLIGTGIPFPSPPVTPALTPNAAPAAKGGP